jgi:fructuronate reductase
VSRMRRRRARAPVRAVHLGLGNFFRSHQAWFTDRATDAEQWGLAAFTGRGSSLAKVLQAQDFLYTLNDRASDVDRYDVVESMSACHANSEREAWRALWCAPDLAFATLTVTEAGYARSASGLLDRTHSGVLNDIETLSSRRPERASTALGMLLGGLLERRDADAGPIALVSCDNLTGNGRLLEGLLLELAELVDPTLAAWMQTHVSFVTTVVDRITPATTAEDLARVRRETGAEDRAPVVTEAFAEWILQGAFPSGRPDWESAGAIFVADATPFEARKLALLNGAHSCMAYAGAVLGHETVSSAIASERMRGWVEEWWDDACRHLTLGQDALDDYRRALLVRFANPRIKHRLAQIAADGSVKLPVRILPTVRAERSAGRLPLGGARVIAAWIAALRGEDTLQDPRRTELLAAATGGLSSAAPRVLALVDPELADDGELVAAVIALHDEMRAT